LARAKDGQGEARSDWIRQANGFARQLIASPQGKTNKKGE
jgi:hypothetical protein